MNEAMRLAGRNVVFLAYWWEDVLGGLVLLVPLWLIFGFATRTINRNKGYEGGFWWGFLLGPIGLIIIACKPDNRVHRNVNGAYSIGSEAGRNDMELERLQKLKMYKDLLDSGAITQEEFEAKKNVLMG